MQTLRIDLKFENEEWETLMEHFKDKATLRLAIEGAGTSEVWELVSRYNAVEEDTKKYGWDKECNTSTQE